MIALEEWLPRNLYIVAGVFIVISLLQVLGVFEKKIYTAWKICFTARCHPHKTNDWNFRFCHQNEYKL